MITIDFTYETKFTSTQLHSHIECIDFEQDDIIKSMLDWCESNGFKMRRIDMNHIGGDV